MAIIGIDLGTTNSLVSVYRNGRPELLPNELGQYMTPSCVGVLEDGSVVVGAVAKESDEDLKKIAGYFSTVVREKARREGGAWTRFYEAKSRLK